MILMDELGLEISPEESKARIDPERQEKAKEFARIRRRLMLAETILGGIYTLAWLVPVPALFGADTPRAATALREALLAQTTNTWLVVAGFVIVFAGIYYFLTLPISYFSGFVLPHRYELSTQSLRGWLVDQAKGLVLGGVLSMLIVQVIYALLRIAPETWWLWVAGALLLFNVILANLGPVLFLPIFFKLKPLEDEHAELAERLKRLAEKAGTRVRGVYRIDMSRRTKAANAALTGLGNTRRILLGDTLLDEFEAEEIETVMAHEFAHHAHNDIPIGILVGSGLTLGGLYLASLGLRWGVQAFGFQGVADVAAFPLLVLVMGLYGLVTMPLQNAYSRWRERRADEYALRLTGKGEAYASALTRLANQNLADVDPEPWVEALLLSHPPLGKRIRMAEEFN
jgi:STE24 endopeptidase